MTPAPSPDDGEQLALIGPRGGILPKSSRRAPGGHRAAATDPVAVLALDVPAVHLDRPYEYLVPQSLDERAQPGARVRVTLGSSRRDGFLLERRETAEHQGRLRPLDAVLGQVPVLTEETLELCRRVARHYASGLADVLRLAVPPRHAGAEARVLDSPPPQPADLPLEPAARRHVEAWAEVPELRSALADPGPAAPRVVWQAPPGRPWAPVLAMTLRAQVERGRGGIVVVPDSRDLDRLRAAMAEVLPAEQIAVLNAEQGPEHRYAAFVRVITGRARVVVGTRAAAYAPVQDPGLFVVWSDGDDNHAERHRPGPHSREVLAIRSELQSTGLLIAGFDRTPTAQRWVEVGWAREAVAPRGRIRASAPMVVAAEAGPDHHTPEVSGSRLPPVALAAIRDGLAHGPVLVGVAHRGYVTAMVCQACRTPAGCVVCDGPIELTSGHATPQCGRCGALAANWHCRHCGDSRLRSRRVGSERTAEELGRAFPGVRVIASAGDRVVDHVGASPAVVVATPGAEPVAESGYATAVLLDGRALLGMPGLRAGEHLARTWFGAAALVRPGGAVVVTGPADAPQVQALVRWAPAWFAARELAERRDAGMPPARRAVEVRGPAAEIEEIVSRVSAEPFAPALRVLGPVPVPGQEEPGPADGSPLRSVLLLIGHRGATALTDWIRGEVVTRSAERRPPVSVRVDPVDLR